MLSIITPVYNGEDHIEGCIQNVIDQRYFDVEHIIIDDGSTDKTAEIVKKFTEKYPHIKYHYQKNQGQSTAYNNGIKLARGKIISLLNDDDFYEPNIFNDILKMFENLPESSLVCGNCNVLGKNDAIVHVNKPKKLKIKQLLLGSDVSQTPATSASCFYHKSLHDKIGLYRTDEHYIMDLYFIFDSSRVANMVYVDKVLSNFRFVPGTKTYSDTESGEAMARYNKFIKKYRRGFSFRDRCEVFILRKLYLIFHPVLLVDVKLGLFGIFLKKKNPKIYYKLIRLKELLNSFIISR